MKRFSRASLAVAFFLTAASLLAHFSWINPVGTPLQIGKTVEVQIGNGHNFPQSESIMEAENLQLFAISPSGTRTTLRAADSGAFIHARYKVTEAGMYRFYFVNDRGVLSRTTKGRLPGGRDRHPKALESYRILKSGVAYGLTPDAAYGEPEPVGIPFEMLAEVSDEIVTLTVLKNGKLCPDAEIHVGTPSHHGKALGKTGPDGKFRYDRHHDSKGRILFLAEYTDIAPESANYDRGQYSAALHLDLP